MKQSSLRKDALQDPANQEPASKHLFRKLEILEHEMDSSSHTGQTRWIVPYADLLTLLLGLFLVLFANKGNLTPAMQASQPAPLAMSVKQLSPSEITQQNRAARKTNPLVAIPAKQETSQSKNTKAIPPTPIDEMRQLEAQLQLNLKGQGLEIRHQERGVVISLKDSILFAPGQAELSPQARKTLDRVIDQLQTAIQAGATPSRITGSGSSALSRPIRVEGHTDNSPITTSKYPSNWELSTARATTIVRYLIATRHFSPDKLSAAGYGEFRPVENNSSIEGKQKNRRVDIVILNDNTAHQEPPSLTHETVHP